MSANISKQLEAAGVGIAHYFGGGAYVKETVIPAGAALAQHAHEHNHLAYLARGTVWLTVDGAAPRRLVGPCCVLIEANRVHGVCAILDSVWLCVWATDCEDPGAIDDVLVGRGGTG